MWFVLHRRPATRAPFDDPFYNDFSRFSKKSWFLDIFDSCTQDISSPDLEYGPFHLLDDYEQTRPNF